VDYSSAAIKLDPLSF